MILFKTNIYIALFGSLCAFLVFNWSPSKVFLGDSGSTFLGAFLSGIILSEKNCKKLRSLKLNDSKNFFQLLFKFGYKTTNDNNKKIKIYKNFQRRFRPQLISSIVDKESYEILKSLI